MILSQIGTGVRQILQHPSRVALICSMLFVFSIVFNGNVFRLWGLYRDYDRISEDIVHMRQSISLLTEQLKQAKDPNFIERQARDKLDLAGEHDLVFVFPEQ